ncbi:UvrD-helicase domain-containing protein [Succinatimonas hippei]|uniref:UvrD-helicase domain-containing protein n=1 Tax=Succinatimonas hippei TaxID=626938 RepID=UPI0023F6F1BE|nr:UvrD-helicase domain-containing protein [Succinatimonas hippei]
MKDSQTEEFLLKRNILVKVFQNGEKYLLDLLTQDERYFYLEILKPEHIDYVKRIRTICEDALNVKYKEFFENAENYPLTVEQRLAVIRNNDYNLILAAAGTGKTSVIVAKALYLVVSKQAQPKDILILAYNKNAAEELRQRIKERAEKIELDVTEDFNIFTFHALGRSIIQNSKERTYLTKFEEDPKALLRWVDMWLYSYLISDPQALKLFLRLFMTHISFDSVIKRHSQDLVETKEKEIFDEELRTLNNELVKSKEEQFIANWLFLHSVPYKYEDNYVVKQRVEVGFDYRPDFHILNTNIYLEHFGIDREGNTRSDIDKETYN